MVTEADWQYWKKEDLLPYLDTIFDSFGPDRILFGSDWPVCTLAAPYKQVTEIVFDYIKQFPNEDRNKVLGINANKVYNLKYSDL
jgi:L-fuconolactonase